MATIIYLYNNDSKICQMTKFVLKINEITSVTDDSEDSEGDGDGEDDGEDDSEDEGQDDGDGCEGTLALIFRCLISQPSFKFALIGSVLLSL